MTATGPVDPPRAPEHLVLAGGFPPVARGQWLDAVDAVVRRAGRTADADPQGSGVAALTRTTPDGIAVPPLLTADDVRDLPPTGVPGAWPFTRGARAARPDGWDVRQRHADEDAGAVCEAVLADLERGVTSVWLGVGEGGVRVDDLPRALDGVLFGLAPVALDAGPLAVEAAQAFLALAADRGVADADLLGSLGVDPIGLLAREGVDAAGTDLACVVPLAVRAAASYPQLAVVGVDATPVREAGGSDAQQIGFSLAAGVAYLRTLVDGGLDVATAARLLEFRYSVSPEQFPTIALLRAARRTWARVLDACGTTEVPQRQHAVLPAALLTRRDPWVNLLRGTVAAFAAGVGGADAVTVPPFDAAVGVPQAFSRRIARNTQVLLMEESHVARVVDPAGGSYAVERLTGDLAQAAWDFFQQVEREGGAAAALDSGFVADAVATVRARRERDVATRATPITGVSEFADLDERPLDREPLLRRARGGLPLHRPSAPYEALRDRADALLARDGTRPVAFLATLGPLPAHAARAGFARNLLRAGGIDAVDAGATQGVDDVLAAYDPSATSVAVLCSTDALYAERAAETVEALRAAGARLVLLAGRPAADAAPDHASTPDGHLFEGCDVLAILAGVHRTLEGAA